MKSVNILMCLNIFANLLLLIIIVSGQFIQESFLRRRGGSPAQCVSSYGQPGGCVSFESCPPLLKILTDEAHVPSSIKLLQRLTCGFEKEEPMICCPVYDIVTKPKLSNTPSNEFNPVSQFTTTTTKEPFAKPADTTPYPFDPIWTSTFTTSSSLDSSSTTEDWSSFLPQEENEQFLANDRFQGKLSNFRSHINFNLLPTLKECSQAVQSERIVGGINAALASYPWMVRIGYRSEETGQIDFYCGGTIINKRYILTAGHCTEEIDDEELTPAIIRVGEHDTTSDEDCDPSIGCTKYEDYKIEKIIPHEGYNTDDKSNDIELIRVDRDISFDSFAVSPICLPFPVEYNLAQVWRSSFIPSRNKAFVTGWGRTKWNKADGSSILQEVKLPIISNANCQHNYTNRIILTSKQMCAGGVKEKDSCGGDSGGPLQFPVVLGGAEAKFFQLGVVSFGPVQCGVGLLPGVYTRVSAYRDWILNNLKP